MQYKIDWSKITDKVAVNCRTEEEAEIFVSEALKQCSIRNKENWKATRSEWSTYQQDTCYDIKKKVLGYTVKSWYERENYKIISFTDILITSPRDQSIKSDGGKLRMELIPPETFTAVAEVLSYGAEKYGANKWQGVEPDRYVGALLRHFTDYLQDPNGIDEESGLSHIKHVLCNAVFLMWFEEKKEVEQ